MFHLLRCFHTRNKNNYNPIIVIHSMKRATNSNNNILITLCTTKTNYKAMQLQGNNKTTFTSTSKLLPTLQPSKSRSRSPSPLGPAPADKSLTTAKPILAHSPQTPPQILVSNAKNQVKFITYENPKEEEAPRQVNYDDFQMDTPPPLRMQHLQETGKESQVQQTTPKPQTKSADAIIKGLLDELSDISNSIVPWKSSKSSSSSTSSSSSPKSKKSMFQRFYSQINSTNTSTSKQYSPSQFEDEIEKELTKTSREPAAATSESTSLSSTVQKKKQQSSILKFISEIGQDEFKPDEKTQELNNMLFESKQLSKQISDTVILANKVLGSQNAHRLLLASKSTSNVHYSKGSSNIHYSEGNGLSRSGKLLPAQLRRNSIAQ